MHEKDDTTRPETIHVDREEIPPRQTGARILLTLLFMLVSSVVQTIFGALVLFCLSWTLITRRAPLARIRALANRVATYEYRIRRYLGYNESEVPFPFTDLPEALEAPSWRDEQPTLAALGLEAASRRTSDEFGNA
jgi:hypothetical protein